MHHDIHWSTEHCLLGLSGTNEKKHELAAKVSWYNGMFVADTFELNG